MAMTAKGSEEIYAEHECAWNQEHSEFESSVINFRQWELERDGEDSERDWSQFLLPLRSPASASGVRLVCKPFSRVALPRPGKPAHLPPIAAKAQGTLMVWGKSLLFLGFYSPEITPQCQILKSRAESTCYLRVLSFIHQFFRPACMRPDNPEEWRW